MRLALTRVGSAIEWCEYVRMEVLREARGKAVTEETRIAAACPVSHVGAFTVRS